MRQKLVNKDCVLALEAMDFKSIDIVITSPPYNIGVNYNTYDDNLSADKYLNWVEHWLTLISMLLKDDGSFFLNISGSVSNMSYRDEIYSMTKKYFTCQNHIVWVKSIYIPEVGHQFGHFKPVNSSKYLNNVWEPVFHLTKNSNGVPIDKLSIGAPYSDKSNITRWGSQGDCKCKGNVWFIPYPTRRGSTKHPAQFPPELAKQCILMSGKKDPLVLDPFGGIGSTAVACKELDMRCISIEIDKDYHEEALTRIKNTVKDKPVREYT